MLIAPYYSRRTGRVVAGNEALILFLNGDRAPRRPADKLPNPHVTPDAIAKFRDHVERHVKRAKQPLVYTSRGRRLVFYWSPKGGRLLVRIRPSKVNKLAEALAPDRRLGRRHLPAPAQLVASPWPCRLTA